MSRKQSVLVARSASDDLVADSAERDAVIAQYSPFVEGLVGRLMRSMHLPQSLREDFIAAGYLGLVEAASRFDPSRGSEFRSYAFLRIRGAVVDHIRSSCEVSGKAYRMLRAIEIAQELRLQQEQSPKNAGLDDRTRAGRAIEMLGNSAMAFSLVRAGEEVLKIADDGRCDPERIFEEKQQSQKIQKALATLPEKERTIIEQYYFRDRKLVEVAEQYSGLSKSWVSRLHDRALAMLRDSLMEDTCEERPQG
jgi:RNA polymerase sigma factor for flagellar operon FliA